MMETLQQYPGLLAVVIFAMRVVDVSLATVRTILVMRGHKAVAGCIAFVEVLVWVAAVGQVLQNLHVWYLAMAYAAGFATGNVVGVWLEARLAMGLELVRAISVNPDIALAERLRGSGFHVTEVAGRGEGGSPVEVLLVVEKRRKVPSLLRVVEESDPDAVCTMSDVRRHESPPVQRQRRRSLFDWRGAGRRK